MSTAEKLQRTLTGTVTSDKMDKSITVMIERRVKHPIMESSSNVLLNCMCMMMLMSVV